MRQQLIEMIVLGGGIGLAVFIVHTIAPGLIAHQWPILLLIGGVLLVVQQVFVRRRRRMAAQRRQKRDHIGAQPLHRQRDPYARELNWDWTGLVEHTPEETTTSIADKAPDGADPPDPADR
jgi:hypothetical protein